MYTVSHLIQQASEDYALLDSGNESKLEKFGTMVLARPDPQALYPKKLSEAEWKKADAWYERKGNSGVWHSAKKISPWNIAYGGNTLQLQLTSFKHTGLFPEQKTHWEWMAHRVATANAPKVLNLFGYTGGATLALARAGAQVVHVDSSKTANAWARKNAQQSSLDNAPIRWITEDARLFVDRELKRGNRYDAVVMDPPAFGHGPKKELWKIEEHLIPLVRMTEQLLSDKPLFFVMSGYAAGYSAHTFAQNLEPLMTQHGGEISCGEMLLQEQESERVLACGIYARWRP